MTLYYSIVYVVLVVEMICFLVLVAPIPAAVTAKLIRGLRTPIMTRFMNSVKFLFIFILVLFIDSIQRVTRRADLAEPTGQNITVADRGDYLARKFYDQRNMYLCGFTLFLSLILNRTYRLVKLNNDLQLQLGDSSASGDSSELSLKAQDYKARLDRKKRDYDVLKAENDNLNREFNRVTDELKVLQGKQAKKLGKAE